MSLCRIDSVQQLKEELGVEKLKNQNLENEKSELLGKVTILSRKVYIKIIISVKSGKRDL